MTPQTMAPAAYGYNCHKKYGYGKGGRTETRSFVVVRVMLNDNWGRKGDESSTMVPNMYV